MNTSLFRGKSFRYLLAVFLCSTSLSACQEEEYGQCGKPSDPGYWDIYDMTGTVYEVEHIEETTESTSETYSYYNLIDEYTGEEIGYDDFIFKLEFITSNYSAQLMPGLPFIPFISQVYACSPAEPDFSESVVVINVTSSQPYTSELAAGDSLGDVVILTAVFWAFDQYGGFLDAEEEYQTLNEVFSNGQTISAEEMNHSIHLGLNQPPAQSGEYIFFIEVVLDNGETYTYETPAILLIGSDS